MKNKKSKEETFTKVSDAILSSKHLTANQKLIISYVIRWQSSGKVCYESNKTLASKFGISVSGLKKQITQLNKLPFFKSKETSSYNSFGKWMNSKQMIVDEAALKEFLESKNEMTVVNKNMNFRDDVVLDNLSEFKAYVDEITNESVSDIIIENNFNLFPDTGYARTKENILHVFQSYIPTPPSS